MRIILTILAVAVLSSCAEEPRPDFLSRVQEDCRSGSPEACMLLQSLQQQPVEPGQASPARRAVVRRSQTQRNTDAILQGMERARATPRPLLPPPGDS